MGILCVFCVYDTIGNRCFEKTSFPKMKVDESSKFQVPITHLNIYSLTLIYHSLTNINKLMYTDHCSVYSIVNLKSAFKVYAPI